MGDRLSPTQPGAHATLWRTWWSEVHRAPQVAWCSGNPVELHAEVQAGYINLYLVQATSLLLVHLELRTL